MPTKNVVITEHQAKLIEELVASGRYQNASEVLRAGLRLVAREEAEYAAKLKALREAVAAGEWSLENEPRIVLETKEDIDRFFNEIWPEDASDIEDG